LVNSGGTLAGFGSVAGSVVVAGGSLAPGLSPGALTIGGDLELGAGSDYFWQIDDWDGAPTVNYDTLSIAGSLDITATSGNPFTLHLEALTLDPIPEGTWTIA